MWHEDAIQAFVFGFRIRHIWDLSQLSLISPIPSTTISRLWSNFFPRMAPHFLVHHDSPSNLAESRYPPLHPTHINDVTSHFRHISSHSRFDVTLPGFEKVFFSTSKNVTIFLELGTNVTISSRRHIIILGSAWTLQIFKTWPGPGLSLGSGFQVFQFRLGTTLISNASPSPQTVQLHRATCVLTGPGYTRTEGMEAERPRKEKILYWTAWQSWLHRPTLLLLVVVVVVSLLIQLNPRAQNVSRPWREPQRRYKSELRSTKHENPVGDNSDQL